jgi:hypothetical protein
MYPPELPPAPSAAGFSLSGSDPYVITADENRAVCATLGTAAASDGTAHPVYFFIATQVGMGKTVSELCAACEFDVDDGPMIASSHVVFSRALVTDVPYWVTGEIKSLTRKRSRTLGVMDLLEYVLRLTPSDGARVLETTNVWVLPRRNLA